MSFGLVVNPYHTPTAADLAELRPPFLRSILYTMGDLERLLNTGLPLLVTANNEMAEAAGWSNWDGAIRAIAERGRGQVFAVCVGNEFDTWWKDNPADVPPSFAADLVRRAARILRPYGIKTVATSVAGPQWQEYLEEMAALCREEADWFDLHGYGQRPDGWGRPGWGFGDLRAALSRAHELAGKPVIMSEYGVKIEDAGSEQAVADFMGAAAETIAALGPDVCPHAAWFAYHDGIGTASEQGPAAFGLVSADGRRRTAWQAFADLNRATVPIEPPPPPDPPVIEPEPMLPAAELAWRDLWQSATAPPEPVPFAPGTAFFKHWRANRQTVGLPVGPERQDASGTYQAFSGAGVLKWAGGGEVVAA